MKANAWVAMAAFVAMGVFCWGQNARATEETFVPQVELATGLTLFGPSASVEFSSSVGAGTTTQFLLGARSGYFLTPEWELTFSPSVEISRLSLPGSSPLTATSMIFLAGPTYNFLGKPQDSFYVSVQAGFAYQTLTDYNSATAFAYSAVIGKRFELFEHVSYSPSVGVLHVATLVNSATSSNQILGDDVTSATTNWIINPLEFSIFF